ncbi:Di-copper centre-containing protein [Basidiobolus meristosporus CBS 931.73]|uniref:Di-copper centre-containing protein n=1 Tax=Basidiobolus meristosporus CBS 931.73 TaxID=1314790 RepID=A0A1Y1XM11_9FUNG|nr:Di-copper centre-containing protein [Basidiobolus meristosporus CBS 931.73]|eukprot:ORX86788.1 Di-copper centre-containing protein [Basidiobolus meristosporus CBS 931.73]
MRQEIRSLSPAQLQTFIKAIQDLHTGPSPTEYDNLANIHATYFNEAHNNAAFFPWHRKFIREFELALQKKNPSVYLPYWDWSLDSQSPEESIIFSKNYFGGNGVSSRNYCLEDGPFANWTMRYPNVHCLKRQFDGTAPNTIEAFYSPETLQYTIKNATNFDTLRRNIESPPHGVVHIGIGGNEGDMSFATSTNDPLFWLHHAFIDKIWADWQKANPSKSSDYGGVGPRNTRAKLTDIMVPFKVGVNTMMDTTKAGLCYRYAELPSQNFKLPLRKRELNNSTTNAIQDNDTNHWYKLHLPKPLPDSYIHMMGMSVPDVRALEKGWATVTESVNSIATYVSPICLAKKNETLSSFFHFAFSYSSSSYSNSH